MTARHVHINSRFGDNVLAVGKDHYLLGRAAAFSTGQPPKLALYLHGAGETVEAVASGVYHQPLFLRLAQKFVLICGEWGGALSFANDPAIAEVAAGIAQIRSEYNVDQGPVALVGASMGFSVASAFTKAYPAEVSCLAGMIPLCDMQDVEDRNVLGLAGALDTAYGGEYDNTTHGPDHNPVLIAPSLDPDLPVALWASSNDPHTPPATVDAYMAARPQTERYNLGAVGHSFAADPGLWPGGAQTAVADWMIANAT